VTAAAASPHLLCKVTPWSDKLTRQKTQEGALSEHSKSDTSPLSSPAEKLLPWRVHPHAPEGARAEERGWGDSSHAAWLPLQPCGNAGGLTGLFYTIFTKSRE